MRRTVAIISDGTINDPEIIRRKLEEMNNPLVICADGATRYMRRLDMIPAFIIGDMDSVDEDTLSYLDRQGSTILRHSRDKDETDTQLALEYAMKMSPGQIWIFGALGGRIDHALANISLLIMGVKQGYTVKIVDETCELFIADRQHVIEGKPGQTVSFLPLSDEVTGITLKGFEYPLSNGIMEMGRPYGISNRLAAEEGVVSVKSGYLLVIRYFKEED